MDTRTLNLLGALAVGCSDVQDAAMSETGLDSTELATLLAVHTRPGSTIGDIALTAGLTHSGAVRVVDRLSRSDLVERKVGVDRRTVALHCTSAGAARATFALDSRRRALANVVTGLTRAESAAFRSIAEKILSGLPADQPHAWRICRLCDHGACRGRSCPVGTAVP